MSLGLSLWDVAQRRAVLGLSPVVEEPVAPLTNTPAFDHPGIRRLGFRADTTFHGSNQAGAYEQVRFSGTSAIKHFDLSRWYSRAAAAYPYIDYQVDGGTVQTVQLAVNPAATTAAENLVNLTMATGLSAGVHTLTWWVRGYTTTNARWVKGGTTFSEVRSRGYTLDSGAALYAVTPAPKLAYVYADSLGEGYNAISATGAGSGHDARRSALALTMQALGWDYNLAAWSSSGWRIAGHGGAVAFHIPAGNRNWRLYNSVDSRLAQSAPDYAVICTGANDHISSVADADVTASVSGFLTEYRAQYPIIKILLVSPFGPWKKTAIATGFSNYQTSTPDTNAHLIDLGSAGEAVITARASDGYHPNITGHVELKDLLVPAIQSVI